MINQVDWFPADDGGNCFGKLAKHSVAARLRMCRTFASQTSVTLGAK